MKNVLLTEFECNVCDTDEILRDFAVFFTHKHTYRKNNHDGEHSNFNLTERKLQIYNTNYRKYRPQNQE